VPTLQNPKHEQFAQERAKGKSLVVAYERAGYLPQRQNASHLMTRDDVSARVAELTNGAAREAKIDIDRAMLELSRIATADIRSLFREDGSVKPPAEWSSPLAAAISAIEMTTEGSGDFARSIYRVRFWDKLRALENVINQLLRAKGEEKGFSAMSDDELRDEIVRLAGEF